MKRMSQRTEKGTCLKRGFHSGFSVWSNAAIVPLVMGYLLLFGCNALTRMCDFSNPDTMNYVNVAENIKAGKGIAQTAIGFNVPRLTDDVHIPMPLTSQPPIYPLLIAVFSLSGLPAATAAQLLSVVSYGLLLFFSYLLVRRLYDEPAALFAAAALLLYQPLQKAAGLTFSEPLGLMFAAASLLVLVHSPRAAAPRRTALAAGLLTGAAFSTRYALITLVCAGGIYLWFESRDRIRTSACYAAGFLLIAGVVWVRNIRIIGAIMPEANPSRIGWGVNLKKAVMVLLRLTPDSLPSASILVVGTLLVTAALALLLWRRSLVSSLKSIFIDDGRYLPPMFMAGYVSFLIMQRTRTHFDYIDWRLMLPAGVMFSLIFGAGLARSFCIPAGYSRGVLAGLLLVLGGRQVVTAVQHERFSRSAEIVNSERLNWIDSHTGTNDLIVGIDTVDVVFYLNRPSYSISAFPYCDYLKYHELARVCSRLQSDVEEIYFVLPHGESKRDGLNYGPFMKDLMDESMSFPGLEKYASLSRHLVYRVVIDELDPAGREGNADM